MKQPDLKKIKALVADISKILDTHRGDGDLWPAVSELENIRAGLEAHIRFRETGEIRGPEGTVNRLAFPR